jgi:hypothetical protein
VDCFVDALLAMTVMVSLDCFVDALLAMTVVVSLITALLIRLAA